MTDRLNDVYLFSLFHINKFGLWVKYWAFFYPKIDNLRIYSWQFEWRILLFSIISISHHQVLALGEILCLFYPKIDNLRIYSWQIEWRNLLYSIISISHHITFYNLYFTSPSFGSEWNIERFLSWKWQFAKLFHISISYSFIADRLNDVYLFYSPYFTLPSFGSGWNIEYWSVESKVVDTVSPDPTLEINTDPYPLNKNRIRIGPKSVNQWFGSGPEPLKNPHPYSNFFLSRNWSGFATPNESALSPSSSPSIHSYSK